MPVKGGYLAMTGLGALLMYSGLKGKKLSDSLRTVIAGKSPATVPQTTPINTPSDTSSTDNGSSSPVSPAVQQQLLGKTPSAATIASYKSYAASLLIFYGWPTQFGSLNNIVMAESGWDNNAMNPSGAYGIAQSLGHGTPATVGKTGINAYGNYGTPDAVCRSANSGNGFAQLLWMFNYIRNNYHSPDYAWTFHQANGYYLWRIRRQ